MMLGGKVFIIQRRQRAGRRDDDMYVSGKHGGWRSRISGGQGASSAFVGVGDAVLLFIITAQSGQGGGGGAYSGSSRGGCEKGSRCK